MGNEPRVGGDGPPEGPRSKADAEKRVAAPTRWLVQDLSCPRCGKEWGEVWNMDEGKQNPRYLPTSTSTLQPDREGTFRCPDSECSYYVTFENEGPRYIFRFKNIA